MSGPSFSINFYNLNPPFCKNIFLFKENPQDSIGGKGINFKIERNTLSKYVFELLVEQFTSGCIYTKKGYTIKYRIEHKSYRKYAYT